AGERRLVVAGLVRHVAEVALRVDVVQVDGGRHGASVHGDDAGKGFHAGGGGEEMAGHALGRAHRDAADGVAEDGLEHAGLGDVADGGAGGVGVDVVHVGRVELGIGERLAHGGD